MTQDRFDPFALWRGMLAQWDPRKTAEPPVFVADVMHRYLAAMNMPSRADLAMLDERLQKIEQQLAYLVHRMQGTRGKPPAAGKPARTRRSANAPARANGPAPPGEARRAEAPGPASAAKPKRRAAGRTSAS